MSKSLRETNIMSRISRPANRKRDTMRDAVTNHGKLTAAFFKSWAKDANDAMKEWGIMDNELVMLLKRIASELENNPSE